MKKEEIISEIRKLKDVEIMEIIENLEQEFCEETYQELESKYYSLRNKFEELNSTYNNVRLANGMGQEIWTNI